MMSTTSVQLPAVLDYRALAGEIARIQAMSMSDKYGGGRTLASHPVWPTPTTKPKGAAEAAAQLLDLLLRCGNLRVQGSMFGLRVSITVPLRGTPEILAIESVKSLRRGWSSIQARMR